MTAFDNIKTNNWPATSNDFEDFLVLELPLNDQAALTSSRRDIVAGSKVLFPKRTLTNTGVSSLSTEGRVWSDTLDAANTSDLPFRSSRTIQDAFGSTSVQVETATNGEGRIIWLDFANNAGAITGSTLKVLSGGLTTSLRDVYLNNASTKSGQLDDLLNITGVTVNSIQIKSNAANAGAGFAGIELDGVRLVDPVGGPKNHYDNNAVFANSYIDLPASSDFYLGTGDFTVEMYFRTDTYSQDVKYRRLFMLDGPTGNNAANLQLLLDTGATGTGGTAYMFSASGSLEARGSTNHSDDVWHHAAITRSNGTAYLWIDGSQIASQAYTGDVGALNSNSPRVRIGAYSSSEGRFQGEIQDLRIYKGVAKYTSNFTPPGAILG